MPELKNKIKGLASPKLKLTRGTRLTSAIFISISLLIAAGVIIGANMYYDIDTSKIMVEEAQEITKTLTATTTNITAGTNAAVLTVTQQGTGAIFLATSTSSMTADAFKITNLGSGNSFVVDDEDPETSAFVIDSGGQVGVASSTPSDTLSVQGNIIGSGNIILFGTSASSTFAAGIEVTQVRITGGSPADGLVLTATDARGNTAWESIPTGVWIDSGTVIYPTAWSSRDIAIASTSARYDLDVWGDFAVGTSTAWNVPALYVDSGDGGRIGIGTTTLAGLLTVGTTTHALVVTPNGNVILVEESGFVGIATTTPSDTLSVQGNIIGSGNIIVYGLGTSTFGGGIDIQAFKLSTGASNGSVLTSNGGGYGTWQSVAGITPSNWSFISVNAIRPTSTNIGIIIQASSTISGFAIDSSGNATTSGNIYAEAFISTGDNAYTRKAGQEIIRGVVPIFGFDLPVRCNTSCNSGSATATISRVIENNGDMFPGAYLGTTRKYRFSFRYADATTTAGIRTTWDIATSSDPTYIDRFTLQPSSSIDLAKGFATTTNNVTLPSSDDWFLRVSTGGTGGYDLQIYEILLIGLDEVN